MKKHLLWLSVVIVVAVASMSEQVKNIIAPAKAVDKSLSIALYKEGAYASDIYNNTSATVHITIEKVSGKTRKKVWEKTFDAQMLKQYPSFQEAVAQTVKVPNVFTEKEHLEVSYVLTYNTKGSELQMQSGIVVNGKSSDKVYIGI